MKDKIYISGGIKNVDNYREIFANKEKELINKGYTVVNPVTVGELLLLRSPELKNLPEKELYKAYMKEDLKALLDCDKISMLENWENSNGANDELYVANICGIGRYGE